MKQKISISIDEDKLVEIEKLLIEGQFRNKSHLIEYSVDQLLKGMKK